jgi:hypothetical protein
VAQALVVLALVVLALVAQALVVLALVVLALVKPLLNAKPNALASVVTKKNLLVARHVLVLRVVMLPQ